MDCNKTDCIHYKVCEEWKSLGNDNYINESNGNCDCYSAPYNPTGDAISRSDLKDKMKKAEEQADTYEMLVEFYEQIIDNAQAVEPERPQGEWLFKHNSSDIWCSVCDENFDEIPQAFNFCPNCGADMRKGGE